MRISDAASGNSGSWMGTGLADADWVRLGIYSREMYHERRAFGSEKRRCTRKIAAGCYTITYTVSNIRPRRGGQGGGIGQLEGGIATKKGSRFIAGALVEAEPIVFLEFHEFFRFAPVADLDANEIQSVSEAGDREGNLGAVQVFPEAVG